MATEQQAQQHSQGPANGSVRVEGAIRARPGDALPDVPLRSTAGRVVSVTLKAADRHVVLFCFPGDREGLRYPELAGCTPEACSFSDRLSDVTSLGATVFGLSLQSTERQQRFVEREHLTFELLSDDSRPS